MVVPELTGGLCNQLYQVCAAIEYSKLHNMPYAIPTKTTNVRWKSYKLGKVLYRDYNTSGFFKHEHHDIRYNERPYNIRYEPIPFHKDILLKGHFLSHKYFSVYRSTNLSMLGFNWNYRPSTIAVHTRVGDYKKLSQYLPVLSLEYYQKAVRMAFGRTGIDEILVFGEDFEHNQKYFTKENFPYLKSISFSVGKNEIEDLESMSGCPVLVAANSTYSIWANYLNHHRYKIMIAPKQYYGPAYGYVDCGDLWPEKTILV